MQKIEGFFKMMRLFKQNKNVVLSCEEGITWLKNGVLPEGGLIISSKKRVPYPEVSGYTIPTLYQWGEKELARSLTMWLITKQNDDGSFSAPDGTPYTFDTGQVIRGLLAALGDIQNIEEPLRRSCDWILTQVQSDGRLATPSTKMWGETADDRIHLYVLPPLIEAGKRLNEPSFIEAANRSLQYYKKKINLHEFDTLSHFNAYVLEALCDLGEIELAKTGMEQVTPLQRRNGSIPAYKNVSWICSTGLAQYALIWYKLGTKERADNALTYLEKKQNLGGGFYGGYGFRAKYFPKEEISWAVKFFLDAQYWRIKTSFNKDSVIFSESIDEKDGRVQAITSFLSNLDGKRVIDVGCGKGRFLRILKKIYANSQLYGIDISGNMLQSCPDGVETLCCNILDIKYPDEYFDAVYCVEALEHAIRTESALKEMARILKPGGKIVIIDKNISKLGRLKIEPWERWFNEEEVISIMKKYNIETKSRLISYGKKQDEPDGLFIAWEGIKKRMIYA